MAEIDRKRERYRCIAEEFRRKTNAKIEKMRSYLYRNSEESGTIQDVFYNLPILYDMIGSLSWTNYTTGVEIWRSLDKAIDCLSKISMWAFDFMDYTALIDEVLLAIDTTFIIYSSAIEKMLQMMFHFLMIMAPVSIQRAVSPLLAPKNGTSLAKYGKYIVYALAGIITYAEISRLLLSTKAARIKEYNYEKGGEIMWISLLVWGKSYG